MLIGNNYINKVLCLGDSLTYGYGVGRSECWAALAVRNMGREFVNCGVCGDTSCGMLARFPSLVAEHRPDAVFVMGGSGVKPFLGMPPRMLYKKISGNWLDIEDFKELDGIHPNKEGNRLMSELVIRKVGEK